MGAATAIMYLPENTSPKVKCMILDSAFADLNKSLGKVFREHLKLEDEKIMDLVTQEVK
jgi:hypothetical protein